MAHQSGYGGSIAWDENSIYSPSWNTTIESWKLRYAQRQYETSIMGALAVIPWSTVTLGIAHWTAQVVYLVASNIVTGNMALGLEVVIKLQVNADDYFWGTGITHTTAVDVPLDGAIRATVSITGISQLDHMTGP